MSTVPVIRSQDDYLMAMKIATRLMSLDKNADGPRLRALSAVIADWEERHYKIEKPHPIDAIKFRLHCMGITQAEAARRLGIDRSNLNSILSGKKPLGLKTIKRIHHRLGVPLPAMLNEKLLERPKSAPARSRTPVNALQVRRSAA